MKNKKGFTLVELLAVIAILAILVIIALPNVVKMFNDSKRNLFITEVKTIYKEAEKQWISDSMFNTNEIVYSRCQGCTGKSLKLSGRTEIEYYIRVNKAGKVVEFYVTDGTYQYVHDDNEQLKIEDITDSEEIVKLTDEDVIDIKQIIDVKTIVKYPEGKDKNTVNTGDIVKLSDEEFYVMKRNGNDLYLLAKYNLNVGIFKYNQGTIGIQNSHCIGIHTDENNQIRQYGIVGFGSNYWNNNVGEGKKYSGSYSDPNYPYVYDENSDLYQYVEDYRDYLVSKGIQIKEARIMSYQEAVELGCVYGNCDNAPSFVIETSYYLGSAYNFGNIWMLFGRYNSLTYGSPDYIYNFGVRPVIVI